MPFNPTVIMQDNQSLVRSEPDLWGGMECTINRVHDHYYDQLEEIGHYARPDDLDHIASLNVKAVRYPILWERHEPEQHQDIDWSFASSGLEKLSEHGITPIVGLLHHGSGPRFTGLLDDDFSYKFQAYAKRVATRFPEVEYYCPVNEPLTTARFSGLYGLWFPHSRQPLHFARMLLNQLKAVVLAMQAIRSVNPAAKLVQTEDLAKVHSTFHLQYQASFENVRRWLTYDILCGNVTSGHEMWHYLRSVGITSGELQFFLENRCPPDIIGLNYYVTSERYIDHRCELYTGEEIGGNGKDRYVDVAACRSDVSISMADLLKEVWARYQLPMAITEAHLNCTREEQLRWFMEIWQAAKAARENGMDIKAVTAWSVFGAYDWDSLATRRDHHYESGAFASDGNTRRPTALASMLTALGGGKEFYHPLLRQEGWWRVGRQLEESFVREPLLIVYRPGPLAIGILRTCEQRRIPTVTLTPDQLGAGNMFNIVSVIRELAPWGIIDAYNSWEPLRENDMEPYFVAKNLSTASALSAVPLMIFSHGRTTARATREEVVSHLSMLPSVFEREVLNECASALIIRCGDVFSPWSSQDFAIFLIESQLHERSDRDGTIDYVIPTYLPHLLNSSLDLLVDNEKGIWAAASHDRPVSLCEFAEYLVNLGGFSRDLLETMYPGEEAITEQINVKPDRPERSIPMPPLGQAIKEYLVHLNYQYVRQ